MTPGKSALCLLALSLLLACSPQRQTFRPGNDAGVGIGPDTMLAQDNLMLPLRSWLPAAKPKAVIVALHGFNDYSKAYDGMGNFFKAHGVAVYAYDQRGFGQAPYTGIWANQENLIRDAAQCVREVSRRWPGVPVYLMGESMGGAVAIDAASADDFPPIRGLILSAPAVWGAKTINPVFRSTLWLAAHTAPTYGITGSDLKILASNNIPMLYRLAGDPLVIKRTRIDAIYGVVLLMDSAYENVAHIKTPTLLMYGGQDQVIPQPSIQSALEHFTVPVDYVFYPDGFHMLFRDIQGQLVLEDMLSWITRPGQPVPSGLGIRRPAS
jgi:acylglycerol lipase